MKDVDRLAIVVEQLQRAEPLLERAIAELDGATTTCGACGIARWRKPDEFRSRDSLVAALQRVQRAREKLVRRLARERGRE